MKTLSTSPTRTYILVIEDPDTVSKERSIKVILPADYPQNNNEGAKKYCLEKINPLAKIIKVIPFEQYQKANEESAAN